MRFCHVMKKLHIVYSKLYCKTYLSLQFEMSNTRKYVTPVKTKTIVSTTMCARKAYLIYNIQYRFQIAQSCFLKPQRMSLFLWKADHTSVYEVWGCFVFSVLLNTSQPLLPELPFLQCSLIFFIFFKTHVCSASCTSRLR